MTNPIRAALDAAGQATCPTAQAVGGSCAPICLHCPRVAAKAIAAFLRALPDQYTKGGAAFWDAMPVEIETRSWLADAVLAAAKEEPSSDT
jgi:hypothetical protein